MAPIPCVLGSMHRQRSDPDYSSERPRCPGACRAISRHSALYRHPELTWISRRKWGSSLCRALLPHIQYISMARFHLPQIMVPLEKEGPTTALKVIPQQHSHLTGFHTLAGTSGTSLGTNDYWSIVNPGPCRRIGSATCLLCSPAIQLVREYLGP